MDSLSIDVLTFWFGDTDLTRDMEKRDIWFRSTLEFDAELAARYREVHERAGGGAFDHFVENPADCLALAVILDQVPRNIYRATPRAFATDAKAREVARMALDLGHDRGMANWHKMFLYLPFEHSENLADQDRACALYEPLGEERSYEAALAHREAIRKFGRFPHRNEFLGRVNTPGEEAYLEDPPLWGKTAAEVAEIEQRKAAQAAAEAG
ncbi:MAG: DUF924 family protein [Alphaproteobacteria bacterium]